LAFASSVTKASTVFPKTSLAFSEHVGQGTLPLGCGVQQSLPLLSGDVEQESLLDCVLQQDSFFQY